MWIEDRNSVYYFFVLCIAMRLDLLFQDCGHPWSTNMQSPPWFLLINKRWLYKCPVKNRQEKRMGDCYRSGTKLTRKVYLLWNKPLMLMWKQQWKWKLSAAVCIITTATSVEVSYRLFHQKVQNNLLLSLTLRVFCSPLKEQTTKYMCKGTCVETRCTIS